MKLEYDDNQDWFQSELQSLGLYPQGDEWIDHKFGPRTREGAQAVLDGYRKYLDAPTGLGWLWFLIGAGVGMLAINFLY